MRQPTMTTIDAIPAASVAAAPSSPSTLPPAPLARDMLAAHLLRRFGELAAANARRRDEIRTDEDWQAERRRLLAAYGEMLGAFPPRTPLNARTTGVVQRERYAIEKVVFESRPGMLVTANAYVPAGRSWPVPGVLVPCGHTDNGKAGETYQRVCAGLAAKGYFVLIYDPIGQGERKLYWDAERGVSRLGGCTTQHSYAGNQCVLLGLNLAQYMVWDSIRAVDYLISRPEVDSSRIAMAGNSGGGTNTAYTAPLDERIKVVVPCCYITTLDWRRRSWSTGDGEQNLLGQLAAGLDHADMLRLVAPRPLLVGSAALDFFPLEGARESVAAARELYRTLGIEERVTHAVADAPHGYSVALRRATYGWLNRWFDKLDEGDDEPDTPVETDAELQCTTGGQVEPLGSETIFTVNRRRLDEPVPPRPLSVTDAAVALTGFESLAARPYARPAETRLERHEGVRRIERVVLWPELDVAVPGAAFTWRAHPGPRRAALWIDGEGVDALADRPAFRTALADLLPQGWLHLAVDVRGIGETAPRATGRANPRVMGAEAFLTYESFVAGRPLFGMRLRDAQAAVAYLLERPDVDAASGVVLVGWGAGGLLALHLAVLDPRIQAAAAVDTLARYRSLVEHEHYAHPVSSFIPGVVAGPDSPNGYDLDDLVGEMASRPVLRLRPVDHLGQPVTSESDKEVSAQLLAWLKGRAEA
jgi:cephalosporin-C deacetylase-like acetyl esterase